jgi:hypothetical protein
MSTPGVEAARRFLDGWIALPLAQVTMSAVLTLEAM